MCGGSTNNFGDITDTIHEYARCLYREFKMQITPGSKDEVKIMDPLAIVSSNCAMSSISSLYKSTMRNSIAQLKTNAPEISAPQPSKAPGCAPRCTKANKRQEWI